MLARCLLTKHAHNTALQITLESGYLGLATLLWWMSRVFVGFHVAGLVEYNFDDSEVLEIFS